MQDFDNSNIRGRVGRILISGTVTNTVKLQALNSKWMQKKESGEVLSKKERNERAAWTQEDRLKHDIEQQAAQNRETSKKTDIDNKILYGGTLTPEEEKYLEQNAPSALQKYRQIKAEKKAYEEKLEHCGTKDEVQRLKLETMGEYAAAMKKVENNPYIPMSEKLAKAQELLAKTRNVQDAEWEFMQSPKFLGLPTEAEETEERTEELLEHGNLVNDRISDAANAEEVYSEKTDAGKTDTEETDTEKADTEETDTNQTDPAEQELLQAMEDACQRIQLNAQLEQGEDISAAADVKRGTGQKVDLSV